VTHSIQNVIFITSVLKQ